MRDRSKWVALTAVLALTVVGACSGNEPAPEQPDKGNVQNAGQPANNTPSAPEDDKPQSVEITVWDKPKDDDVMKPVIEENWAAFQEKHPHITVKHESAPPGESERQVFITAMAGGTGPDAYMDAHFPIIQDWVKAGYVQDLSTYWSAWDDADNFIPSSLEQATMNGSIYGVPHSMYVVGLLYNKTLFAEAGLDPDTPPADWDQFVEYAKKLTDHDKKQYGYALLGMDWADWFFEYYVWQAGGDLTTRNSDGTITLNLTDEPTVKALEYWRDLKWTHQVVQNNVTQNFDDNKADFFQSRAAMSLGASDWFGDFAKNGVDLNTIGFAPLPAGPSGTAPSQTGGKYWIINPSSTKEKQDAAWAYISFMQSKEAQERLYNYQNENGIMPNLLSVRLDLNPVESSAAVPASLIAGVQRAAEHTQLEYALKERLSPYVVKAIQTVLTNQNADLMAELQSAQELAQREVVDPYNAEIKQ
ncbi:ABC transporter substrate-binding protein [Paenibacillus sp. 598K]|uniref:extracellular solute-binding protein n=1 Tax=Paenibacillus sp. 598K TaxID=1117987 RepID=UPI000FFAD334|nr:extracellular solute-binding protein [Paenibacillus sp. 598K]GBF72539.1 ABC transporter substrate-binding protein [Paenibacillus sp. 598K]